MISKDEMVEFIKKRFEDGLTFEKLELIIEDKDLLAWRDIVSVRDLGKENCIQKTPEKTFFK